MDLIGELRIPCELNRCQAQISAVRASIGREVHASWIFLMILKTSPVVNKATVIRPESLLKYAI